jgi:hypothetical protein
MNCFSPTVYSIDVSVFIKRSMVFCSQCMTSVARRWTTADSGGDGGKGHGEAPTRMERMEMAGHVRQVRSSME